MGRPSATLPQVLYARPEPLRRWRYSQVLAAQFWARPPTDPLITTKMDNQQPKNDPELL